jgi:hypothetical protein
VGRGDQEPVGRDRDRRAGALRLVAAADAPADAQAGHGADDPLGDGRDHLRVGVEGFLVRRAGIGPLVALGLIEQRVDELDGAHRRLQDLVPRRRETTTS